MRKLKILDVPLSKLNGIAFAKNSDELSQKLQASGLSDIGLVLVHCTDFAAKDVFAQQFDNASMLMVFAGVDANGDPDLTNGVAMAAPCPPFCGKGGILLVRTTT